MPSRLVSVCVVLTVALWAAPAVAEVKFEIAKALWRTVGKMLPGTAAVAKPGGAAAATAGKSAASGAGVAVEKLGDTAIKLGAACLAFAKMAVPSPRDGEQSRVAFQLAAARCEAERSKK